MSIYASYKYISQAVLEPSYTANRKYDHNIYPITTESNIGTL